MQKVKRQWRQHIVERLTDLLHVLAVNAFARISDLCRPVEARWVSTCLYLQTLGRELAEWNVLDGLGWEARSGRVLATVHKTKALRASTDEIGSSGSTTAIGLQHQCQETTKRVVHMLVLRSRTT